MKTAKTTQAQLKEAVDSFLYRYDWLTGGTREETERQAPAGIVGLEEMAATVAALAANPNKVAAANAHLMDYALRMVPLKLALYRRKVPGTAEHAAAQAEAKAAQAKTFQALLASDLAELPDNVLIFPFGR